jgi:hypothetical protein
VRKGLRYPEDSATGAAANREEQQTNSIKENAMRMRVYLHAAMLMMCMTAAVFCGSARADEVPIITGEHWVKSTEQLKKAYLIGIANALQVEVAYEGTNPPPDSQSVVPRFARGLKGHTLDSVREALDKWYADHPDRLQRPVVETIWFELVVPGLKKKS